MKFLSKLYHTIRSYFTTKVELLWLIKRQLKITDINFRRIYEDNRSLPNDTDLKFMFKIFNMGVVFIKDFIRDRKINFNFTIEVSLIKAEYNYCFV